MRPDPPHVGCFPLITFLGLDHRHSTMVKVRVSYFLFCHLKFSHYVSSYVVLYVVKTNSMSVEFCWCVSSVFYLRNGRKKKESDFVRTWRVSRLNFALITRSVIRFPRSTLFNWIGSTTSKRSRHFAIILIIDGIWSIQSYF